MKFSVLTLLPFFLIIHSLNANTYIDLGDRTCYDEIQTDVIPIEGGTVLELWQVIWPTPDPIPVSYTHLTLPTNREV